MTNNFDNSSFEAQAQVQNETEIQTWSGYSVALHIFLPVAGLAILWGRRDIFSKLLLQLDRSCISVLCPSLSKREKLLKWAGSRLPVWWSSQSKTLSGGVNDLWKDGSLLCTLINSAIVGACPNPHRHWKKSPSHAQALAYKYLGILPIFSEEDFAGNLTITRETNFIQYLREIQHAINKLSQKDEEEIKFSSQYVARGMGLFSGEQYKNTVFYLYSNSRSMNTSDILLHIRGPYGTYGKATIPGFSNTRPKVNVQNSNGRLQPSLLKRMSIDLSSLISYNKRTTSGDIPINVEMEKDRAKITYVPKDNGMYEINIICNGEILRGSPYNVHVTYNESTESQGQNSKDDKSATNEIHYHKRVISRFIDFIDAKTILSPRRLSKAFSLESLTKTITEGLLNNGLPKFDKKATNSTRNPNVDGHAEKEQFQNSDTGQTRSKLSLFKKLCKRISEEDLNHHEIISQNNSVLKSVMENNNESENKTSANKKDCVSRNDNEPEQETIQGSEIQINLIDNKFSSIKEKCSKQNKESTKVFKNYMNACSKVEEDKNKLDSIISKVEYLKKSECLDKTSKNDCETRKSQSLDSSKNKEISGKCNKAYPNKEESNYCTSSETFNDSTLNQNEKNIFKNENSLQPRNPFLSSSSTISSNQNTRNISQNENLEPPKKPSSISSTTISSNQNANNNSNNEKLQQSNGSSLSSATISLSITSPICSHHIVPEVEENGSCFRKLSLSERREKFAKQHSISLAESISIKENDVKVTKSTTKCESSQLSVLNILETLKVNQNKSTETADKLLFSANSLPDVSSSKLNGAKIWTSLDNDSISFKGLVKQRKEYWDRLSSSSNSTLSLTNSEMEQNVKRSKCVHDIKKLSPNEPNMSQTNTLTRSFDNISSAQYEPKVIRKIIYFNSYSDISTMSIEERKKQLLKENYIKESMRNRVQQLFPVKINVKRAENENNVKLSSRFQYSKNDKQKNSEEVLPRSALQVKQESSQPPVTEDSKNNIKENFKSQFKRAIKYFRNLEENSKVKKKTSNLNQEKNIPDKPVFMRKLSLNSILPTKITQNERRSGSLQLKQVSEKFCVTNLYEDITKNSGSFRGTANKNAVANTLASLKGDKKLDNLPNMDNEDEIKFHLFINKTKAKVRKNVKSFFDVNY